MEGVIAVLLVYSNDCYFLLHYLVRLWVCLHCSVYQRQTNY